ncbi:MAG: hypothetical protein OEZ43_03050 [Gammaproteobacteria bacterium]|nr:hypothetical protein [Gammaproteobacteria bacterium]
MYKRKPRILFVSLAANGAALIAHEICAKSSSEYLDSRGVFLPLSETKTKEEQSLSEITQTRDRRLAKEDLDWADLIVEIGGVEISSEFKIPQTTSRKKWTLDDALLQAAGISDDASGCDNISKEFDRRIKSMVAGIRMLSSSD